jgi:predicted component of type VI protein secretion system
MVTGHLKLLSGEEREDKVYAFDQERDYKIGRSKDADIQLKDIKVSRLHSKITVKSNKYTITDLDSKNGTYVNGEKIQTAQLSDGDQIRLGFSVLQFFLAEKGTHIIESPLVQKKCALCTKVISEADIISGRAEEVNGKHYCPDCLKKFEGAGEEERPEMPVPSKGRPAKAGKPRKEDKAAKGKSKKEIELEPPEEVKEEKDVDLADLIENEDQDPTPEEE